MSLPTDTWGPKTQLGDHSGVEMQANLCFSFLEKRSLAPLRPRVCTGLSHLLSQQDVAEVASGVSEGQQLCQVPWRALPRRAATVESPPLGHTVKAQASLRRRDPGPQPVGTPAIQEAAATADTTEMWKKPPG